MNILILGGTGSMGTPLTQLLAEEKHTLYVTSRKSHESEYGNVYYLIGDAHDNDFLGTVLQQRNYDCIVDFMAYSTQEFSQKATFFLKNTKQYIFLSSCRVYADTDITLSENFARLSDVSDDSEYLKLDEYALAKARQEDIIRTSRYNNWTIIRPYITYNNERLQLGVYEKEQWLYRVLHGKKIVISEDIANKTTALTYGYDVAKVMANIIVSGNVLGETIQVVNQQDITWKEVLDIYVDAIYIETGKRPKVLISDSDGKIKDTIYNIYQYKYDRIFNRRFKSNYSYSDEFEFTDIEIGLKKCIHEFILSGGNFKGINWKSEAIFDSLTGDRTKIKDIPGVKNKILYVLGRYFGIYQNI